MEHDNVSHPEHYIDGSIQITDLVEDKKQECNLCNTVKLYRKGWKDGFEEEGRRSAESYMVFESAHKTYGVDRLGQN